MDESGRARSTVAGSSSMVTTSSALATSTPLGSVSRPSVVRLFKMGLAPTHQDNLHAKFGGGVNGALDNGLGGVIAAHGVNEDPHGLHPFCFLRQHDGGQQPVDTGQRPLGDGEILVGLALDPMVQRREDAEVDVHRLEIHGVGVGNIVAQRADGRLPGNSTGGRPRTLKAMATAAKKPEAVDST